MKVRPEIMETFVVNKRVYVHSRNPRLTRLGVTDPAVGCHQCRVDTLYQHHQNPTMPLLNALETNLRTYQLLIYMTKSFNGLFVSLKCLWFG
jgi:hypothetical protein